MSLSFHSPFHHPSHRGIVPRSKTIATGLGTITRAPAVPPVAVVRFLPDNCWPRVLQAVTTTGDRLPAKSARTDAPASGPRPQWWRRFGRWRRRSTRSCRREIGTRTTGRKKNLYTTLHTTTAEPGRNDGRTIPGRCTHECVFIFLYTVIVILVLWPPLSYPFPVVWRLCPHKMFAFLLHRFRRPRSDDPSRIKHHRRAEPNPPLFAVARRAQGACFFPKRSIYSIFFCVPIFSIFVFRIVCSK